MEPTPPGSRDTERLVLVPATLESADAELHNPLEFAHQLNARVLPGWPPAPRDEAAMRLTVARLRADPAAAEVWYLIVKRHKRVIAGACAVAAGGAVQCALLPQFRGQGYEAEAETALTLRP
ncbi:MAG: hypothetical protein KGJ84_07800 [Elusimicrobia bacterium]|nr:hypothetical protein [Elusimicrobiota bacterium]